MGIYIYFSKIRSYKHHYNNDPSNFFGNNHNHYGTEYRAMGFLYSVFMVYISISSCFFRRGYSIIYISTLSANEKFSPNDIYLGTLLFCTPIIFSNSNLLVSVNIRDNINIITHMYESKNVSILSYLMIYLLITLVCVVKLVKFEDGPLIKRL